MTVVGQKRGKKVEDYDNHKTSEKSGASWKFTQRFFEKKKKIPGKRGKNCTGQQGQEREPKTEALSPKARRRRPKKCDDARV